MTKHSIFNQSTATAIGVALLSLGTAGAATLRSGKKFYSDDPIWTMPKPAPVVNAARRPLSDYYDFFDNTLFTPGEHAPRKGVSLPSQGINTVDEAPDSAWYSNRHATRRMSIRELQAGIGDANPPAQGTWTVVAAKNEGVTPGFRIVDGAGREYLVKFDPLSNPELASAADVISSKFFYALGYNVPENYVVYFDRSQLAIGSDAQIKDASGRRRSIRQADIEEMLAKAPRSRDGKYRAMASRLLPGKPMGPFQYYGTRSDDPNDLVPHEHRRDLRGLRTFAAWLGHDDSKALNTLDMLSIDDGTQYIKHYLIDFGASLGSASFMANSPRDGNVYLFDWKSSASQFFTLGLYAPKWQRAKYPAIPAAGRFEYEIFDPMAWVPDYPNPAFRNENPADRAWAARKIAAFTDEDIRAVVATGRYTDPAAEEWVTRCLIERRNKIEDSFLTGTAGMDRFDIRQDRLEWAFIGRKAASPVQVRWSVFDNQTGERRMLAGETSPQMPQVAENTGYLVAELSDGRGPAVSVYVRTIADRKFVIGVERSFPNRKAN